MIAIVTDESVDSPPEFWAATFSPRRQWVSGARVRDALLRRSGGTGGTHPLTIRIWPKCCYMGEVTTASADVLRPPDPAEIGRARNPPRISFPIPNLDPRASQCSQYGVRRHCEESTDLSRIQSTLV